jgi:uncharacterized protein YndB with AHSA1/START domain
MPAMERVHVEHDFRQPVDRVFAYLSEHEHLETLFGAKITRLRDGEDGTRNGVGSARALKVGPMPPFTETVTEVVPGELIRYRITEGGVLNDHEGVMRFSSLPDGGTRLDYTIVFRGKVPGLGKVVAVGLDKNIRKGLKKVDTRA